MMLTTKSRYAVMAILEVASNTSNGPMKLFDVSEKQTIPLNYLEQIFLKLKNADIVKSVKGPGGGYYLSKPPKELNIIDIIDAVEENTKMTRCSVDKECRKNGVKCMTHDLWKGLGVQIRDYFSGVSVGDILSHPEGPYKSDPNNFALLELLNANPGPHLAPDSIIYLDHNSTTPLLKEAKLAMISALDEPQNPSAIHSFGRKGKKIIETARKQIAKLVGIENHFRDYHITFTASGTEANNLILSNFKQDKIFISEIEHASILSHTKFQDNIYIIKVDKNGLLDRDDLIASLRDHETPVSQDRYSRKLVSVIFANNETGVIQNIKEITAIAHSFGALVHSDCVQALAKIPVDLIDLDVDFVTISAHKIGGPLGAGALISKAKHHLLPHIIGGGQERGLRSGTENVTAIAGFGAAAEVASSRCTKGGNQADLKDADLLNLLDTSLDNDAALVAPEHMSLRNYLETELLKYFPNIKIASDKAPRLPNTSLIINVGKKAETQIIAFDLNNIAISAGAACSSGKIGASKALIAMGFDEEERDSAIRVSLGNSTTKNDIDRFLETYKKING